VSFGVFDMADTASYVRTHGFQDEGHSMAKATDMVTARANDDKPDNRHPHLWGGAMDSHGYHHTMDIFHPYAALDDAPPKGSALSGPTKASLGQPIGRWFTPPCVLQELNIIPEKLACHTKSTLEHALKVCMRCISKGKTWIAFGFLTPCIAPVAVAQTMHSPLALNSQELQVVSIFDFLHRSVAS
jgi:hypothetical protein